MVLNFPKTPSDWQFDLVGLLAIIGESIIDEIVQPLTSSRTIFLPRLLPAPHALIRPSRRTALPTTPITAVGVDYEFMAESIPYFASMIHQIDLLRPFEFQEMKIEFTIKHEDAELNDHPDDAKVASVNTFAPLKLITIFSSLWTAGVLAWAIVISDGPAVVAIALVSLSSSFHSAASYWQLNGRARMIAHFRSKPEDLVLRTREGAFIVIHCSAEVARTLYLGSSSCDYVMGPAKYRIFIYTGTMFLMVGIVVMSNCTWTMQVTLGASYLVLNVIYMFCALTPSVSRSRHWNLQSLNVQLCSTTQGRNYTHSMVLAIRATKSVDWVQRCHAIPNTERWKAWLEDARQHLDDPHWDAEGARDRWMAMESDEIEEAIASLKNTLH